MGAFRPVRGRAGLGRHRPLVCVSSHLKSAFDADSLSASLSRLSPLVTKAGRRRDANRGAGASPNVAIGQTKSPGRGRCGEKMAQREIVMNSVNPKRISEFTERRWREN